MRVPYDRPLAEWIRQLEREGRLYKFYKTDEWKGLRKLVIMEFHGECHDCLKTGRVTEAVTVHHDQEVKQRPDLALSEFYTDATGTRRRNLYPLCHRCHDARHGRAFDGSQAKVKPLTPERW